MLDISSAVPTPPPSRDLGLAAPLESQGWRAHLALTLAAKHGRTRIVGRSHFGPLAVQRPFYPEGEVCHVLLLHPPGGMVGHDKLNVEVDARANAHALFTTPGANKIYKSDARTVNQLQTLRITERSSVEWLPQPLIVYNGAHARLQTDIVLDAESRFIGWDIVCLGRPAAGERFEQGDLFQTIKLQRAGSKTRYLESWHLAGGGPALSAPWGLRNQPVVGTMLATPCSQADLEVAREACANWQQQHRDLQVASTLIGDLIVTRILAAGIETASNALEFIWCALRERVLERAAHRPRIWNT